MSSTPARSSPQAEAPAATVNEAVCNVFRCWVNPAIFSPRLDFAVREWARRSAPVRKALDRSDRVRTEAVKALFVRFGYEDEDAFVRARVLYYMQIGYYALDLREPIETRLNLTPHYLKAFTGVDPDQAEIDAFRAYAMGHAHIPDFELFARAVMSGRYSAFALLRQGFAGHKGWPQAWRKAKPKPAYDFVIIGGGGHGLATAYYLAKTHKRTRVCVIEKGWLGGGNTGRNTTIVRSNYFYPESVALYDLALRLYEGLSRELNFNVMLSQRGILNLAHTQAQLEMAARLTNAMQLNGVDAELWGPNEVRERLPLMTRSLDSRYLPNGGVWQKRGGIARHDAVAWGYARAADRLGVDIVENCEATGFIMQNGACVGVETTFGRNSRRSGRRRGRRPFVATDGQSRSEAADSFLHAAGDGERTGQAVPRHRRSASRHRRLRQPVGQGRDRVRRRSRPHSLLRAARLAADAGTRPRRLARDVPGLRPIEADAAMGRNRRRRSGLVAHHRTCADEGHLSQLRLGNRGLQGDSRRRHAARASVWRPAPTTRSAAPSTFPASPQGASSTRRQAPASSIRRSACKSSPAPSAVRATRANSTMSASRKARPEPAGSVSDAEWAKLPLVQRQSER